jgi:hypothetical protein
MLINLDELDLWKNMLEPGNNFKVCCTCNRWESTRQHHFIIIFLLAHLFRYFQFIFTQSLIDCRFPKRKIENRKERKKEKRKIEWKWIYFGREGMLYYLEIIFTNSEDIFIFLNHNPKVF